MSKKVNEIKPQTFDNFKKVYRYNKVSCELELTDEVIDLQEVINSDLPNCLTSTLDRLLPIVNGGSQELDYIAEYDGLKDDLDILVEASNLAEEYRQKYNLSSDLDFMQVFAEVKKQSVELGKTVSEMQNKIKVGNEDEKKKEN